MPQKTKSEPRSVDFLGLNCEPSAKSQAGVTMGLGGTRLALLLGLRRSLRLALFVSQGSSYANKETKTPKLEAMEDSGYRVLGGPCLPIPAVRFFEVVELLGLLAFWRARSFLVWGLASGLGVQHLRACKKRWEVCDTLKPGLCHFYSLRFNV